MRAERKHCLNTTNIIIKGFPSIKKLFTTTKSRKSMNLSIIVKGIVQLPKTMGPRRNIFLALQRNKKLKRKKIKDYCSLGTGSIGASFITSAAFVASSITFSAIASKGRSNISSFSTSSIAKPEMSKPG